MDANEQYVQKMKNYLATAPDDVWMFVACDVNYDEGLPLIEWMVNQSRCPQAVALAIYWLMSPQTVKGSTSDALARDRQILSTLEANFPNFYQRSALGFDPQKDTFADASGYDWTRNNQGSEQCIPEVLTHSIEGASLTAQDPQFVDWVECRPPELLE